MIPIAPKLAASVKRIIPSAENQNRLSVLAITSQLPWPLNTGGHIRSYHMLRALSTHFRTRVIVPVRANDEDGVGVLRQSGWNVHAVKIGSRTFCGEVRRVVRAAVRFEPYVMYRRHYHSAVKAAIYEEMCREPPDLLYFDHLDPMVFWDGSPPCKVVTDLHNVYSRLLARMAQERRGWTRRYLNREARLLEHVERRSACDSIATFCVSETDATHFRKLGGHQVHVIPNGVDCAAYAELPVGRRGSPLILFMGTMSWTPNIDAAKHLAYVLMPTLRRRIPGARLRIVGRDPGREIQSLASLPGVEVTGTVLSVLPHLKEASLLAIPLETGSGSRLKILEAFAAGLPVVSSPVGCEGLEVQNGEHLIVSECSEFADSIGQLFDDPGNGCRLAENARRLVHDRYDWKFVTGQACEALKHLSDAGAFESLGGHPRAHPEQS